MTNPILERNDDEKYAYSIVSEDGELLGESIMLPHAMVGVSIGWHWQKPKSILYDIVKVEGQTVTVKPTLAPVT